MSAYGCYPIIIKMDNTTKYQRLFAEYKKCHPQKSKQDIQALCNETWKEIKSGKKSFENVIDELKKKASTVKGKLLGWWANIPKAKSEEKKTEAIEMKELKMDTPAVDKAQDTLTVKGKNATPAQDRLKDNLDSTNEKIASFVSLDQSLGLNEQNKKALKALTQEKTEIEKNLKRKQSNAIAQKKVRARKVEVLQQLKEEHPEVASKIAKLDVKKDEVGRPPLEMKMPGLHEAILNIVAPESGADQRRRTELFNCVKTLDDLQKALVGEGYQLSRTATYYRLV